MDVECSTFSVPLAHPPASIFYLLLVSLSLLYAPTRFLHEANPIWRLTSLLWTLEVIGLTLLTIHLVQGRWSVVSGQKSEVSSPSSISHLPSAQALAFSICFFLLAVPWPSGLENLLTQSLMRLNVSTTVELLGAFGVPVIQHGNVIEIATGRVGIDDACSGIRSFQATLMISLFLGELYRLTVLGRVWLVGLGFGLAFAFNVARTLLLTQIAVAKGVGAIASWHDPAGVTILVACFLGLWLLAFWLKSRTGVPPVSANVARASSPASSASVPVGTPPPDSPAQSSKFEVQGSKFDVRCPSSSLSAGGEGQGEVATPFPASSPVQGSTFDVQGSTFDARPTGSLSARGKGQGEVTSPTSGLHFLLSTFRVSAFQFGSISAFQRLSICLTAWLLMVEAGTEFWYRYHEHSPATAKQWSLNTENMGRDFTKIQIPSAIAGQFCANEGTHARWQDAIGNSWQLYYFRWLPAHSLRGRVAIQLAKVHGPEICLPVAGMVLKSYLGVITVPLGEMELALQQYLFTASGTPIHIFYGIYEDPTGSAVLANRRQDTTSRIKAALAGSRNYGQRFLEIAVFGYENPEDAKAALVGELGKLIKVEK